jgi:monoamine oxidase
MPAVNMMTGGALMSINSQYSFYPPQPDNPTDEDRHALLRYALKDLGWVQDMPAILKSMAPPPPVTDIAPPGSLRGVRVGIMGGGLAGLSAAYELRKTGCDITVFDALTDRVGGRVYTYYCDNNPALPGEFGPMRIPVSHETVWHYINLFGLETAPFIQFNPNSFVYLKGTRVRNDENGLNVIKHIYPKYNLTARERTKSWQTLLAAGTDDRLLNATTNERLETIVIRRRYSSKALEWINRSSLQVMEAAGLSQAAVDLTTNFVPLLEGNQYNSFVDYIEEVYPASVVYLYGLPGGMAQLPAAFYRSFFSDNPYPSLGKRTPGSVRYNAGYLIDGIFLDEGGRQVTLRYKYLPTGERGYEAFDYIVCAIPFSTLRNTEVAPLFSDTKMRAIREVYYTPSQKTILCCSERFWEKQGIVGGGSFTDLPNASIWYPFDHARGIINPDDVAGDIGRLNTDVPGVIIGSFNFGLDTTRLLNQYEEMVFEETKREVSAVHGLPAGYLDRVVTDFKAVNWNQEPTFRGAICFLAPEQKRLFSYGMTLPEYGGRVFFAGEHISGVHRWMQGALQTGMQAALDLTATAQRRK